jgi:hypothetical protein
MSQQINYTNNNIPFRSYEICFRIQISPAAIRSLSLSNSPKTSLLIIFFV